MSNDNIRLIQFLKSRPFACVYLVQLTNKLNDSKLLTESTLNIINTLDINEDERQMLHRYIFLPNHEVRLERLNNLIQLIKLP